MNVYDFDGTVIYPDSSYSFLRWSMKKRPALFLRWLPGMLLYGPLFALKLTTKEKFKHAIFGIVRHIDEIDAEVTEFWRENEKNFCRWYLEQKRDDDVIVTASPEFLIKPICDKLGVRCIASRLDKHTALTDGLTCSGEEKVRRFREEYPDAVIDSFYSDAKRDAPLARLAKRAFLVKGRGTKLVPWEP